MEDDTGVISSVVVPNPAPVADEEMESSKEGSEEFNSPANN